MIPQGPRRYCCRADSEAWVIRPVLLAAVLEAVEGRLESKVEGVSIALSDSAMLHIDRMPELAKRWPINDSDQEDGQKARSNSHLYGRAIPGQRLKARGQVGSKGRGKGGRGRGKGRRKSGRGRGGGGKGQGADGAGDVPETEDAERAMEDAMVEAEPADGEAAPVTQVKKGAAVLDDTASQFKPENLKRTVQGQKMIQEVMDRLRVLDGKKFGSQALRNEQDKCVVNVGKMRHEERQRFKQNAFLYMKGCTARRLACSGAPARSELPRV